MNHKRHVGGRYGVSERRTLLFCSVALGDEHRSISRKGPASGLEAPNQARRFKWFNVDLVNDIRMTISFGTNLRFF